VKPPEPPHPKRLYSLDPEGEFALDLPEQFSWLLFQLDRHRDRKLEPLLEEVGLTGLRWRTLNIIRRIEDCSMSDLARFSAIDRTTLTRSIDQLVAEGLIERCAHEKDRRVVLLRLTAEGEVFYGRAVHVVLAYNRRNLAAAPLDQRRDLIRAMASILAGLIDDPVELSDVLSFDKSGRDG
jgi:DNA-binding MarR family transcriptional regulator